MSLQQTLILALAIATCASQNVAAQNQKIEIAALPKWNSIYNGIVAKIGSGNEKAEEKASFSCNIGHVNTIVGEKTLAKWGINCNANVDNSCVVTDTSIADEFYFSKMLKTQTAQLYLRLDQNDKLNITNPAVAKMEVRLAVGGNNWVLDDWGILGLSPKGEFAKLMTQAYKDQASIVLKYKALDPNADNEELTFDFKSYLNVNFNATDLVKEFTIDESSTSWYGMADLEFIDAPWSYKNTKLCFNSITDEIIQVEDATDRCDAVKKIVCDGKIGPDCTKDNADISKAPPLVLAFGETKLTFTPSDYIYFNKKNVLDCRFGDIGDLRTNGSCDTDAVLGAGKLFYQKFIPVLKFNYGGKSTLTLLSQFNGPDDEPSTGGRLFWIIIGGIAALIALVVIVTVVLKKKQQSDDDYYPSYQNVNT